MDRSPRIAIIDPKYSIGIDEMDAQHARWIQLIEEFRSVGSEHLLEQVGINAAEHALEELLKYTANHFGSEEKFIAAHKYPELEAHKKGHRELVAMLAKLLDEVRAHKTSGTPLKLNLLATVWLLEHIMQEDDKYARFILGQASIEGLAVSEAMTADCATMVEAGLSSMHRQPVDSP